jgi:deazaflavin-dependent oxidoreductase (nitroreductase family)
MTAMIDDAHGAPAWVTVFNPIARRLLRSGIPMGPNALITVRGRTSGEPRSTPLAVIDHAGRRWIWSPWGDVHWVRNLRAAGTATLTVRGNEEEVIATELDADERATFFRDVLGPVARAMPFGVRFVRIVDGVDLTHPVEESKERRVFELHSRE